MKNTLSVLMVLALVCCASFAQMQDKSKRPSPAATAQCSFPDGKKITVDYSRPSMKGRKIYGGLVPYDQEWRTGANEATTFVTDTDLMVAGTKVPAGSYTLFTVPSQSSWTLIISKKTGEWGIPYPGEGDDLARIDMKTSALPSPVEQFLISFDHAGGACTLHLDWEKTRASVEIKEAK
jgi:hypothetical protein